VIGAAVEPVLERPAGAHRFLAGGVTFCTLMPMRTVPFRVVAVLGMNDGDYPRQDTPLGFDLLPRYPRKGDRARRLEDRYLFLEAILAAREHLYVGWSGHSPTDDAVQPPSVVVAELRDVLARRCVAADGRALPEACTTAHRLQPFSGAYAPDGLATYSTLWAGDGAAAPAPPIDVDLGAPPTADPLPLEDLVRVFLDPAARFLAERLDVRLEALEAGVDEDEPFELAGLERWRVRAAAFEALRAGEDVDAWMTRERRRGLLPHGAAGEDALAEARDLLHDYRERHGDLLVAPATALPIVVDLGDGRIEGALDGILDGARRVLRIGAVRPRDLLRAWIEHQALCAAGAGRPTLIADEAGLVGLDAVAPDDALVSLRGLVDLRAELLRRPEPLFVGTSHAYAARLDRGEDAARAAARRAWAPSWRPGAGSVPGEGDAPPVARLWPVCPVDDPAHAARFAELAERVWAPVLAALREPEDDEREALLAGAGAQEVAGG
jgi:exodeoxyribonuclease V gamma subunit